VRPINPKSAPCQPFTLVFAKMRITLSFRDHDSQIGVTLGTGAVEVLGHGSKDVYLPSVQSTAQSSSSNAF
jgi:hypothetical protein